MSAWWYQGQVEIMVPRTRDVWCGYGDQVHLCAAMVSQPLPDFVEVSFLRLPIVFVPAYSVRLRITGQISLHGQVLWTKGSMAGIAMNSLSPY